MILTIVSIVITVNNGFNNKPMLSSEVMITLNDVKQRYIYKPNGIFVFTNLADGEYLVRISSRGFQVEEYNVQVDSSKCVEFICNLNPSLNYTFIDDVTKIYLNVGASYKTEKIYLIQDKVSMKIAQDKAFGESFKLFSHKKIASFPYPHLYFIDDDKKSEMVDVYEFEDDIAILGEKLRFEHKRGTKVYEVSQYTIDDKGMVFIATQKQDNLKLLRNINGEYVFLSLEIQKYKQNEIEWFI